MADLTCLVCGERISGTPTEQVDALEEHLAAEHGIDV